MGINLRKVAVLMVSMIMTMTMARAMAMVMVVAKIVITMIVLTMVVDMAVAMSMIMMMMMMVVFVMMLIVMVIVFMMIMSMVIMSMVIMSVMRINEILRKIWVTCCSSSRDNRHIMLVNRFLMRLIIRDREKLLTYQIQSIQNEPTYVATIFYCGASSRRQRVGGCSSSRVYWGIALNGQTTSRESRLVDLKTINCLLLIQ